MNRKIPPDAFSYYFSLGTGRSYQAVAEHYGVSKRAVSNMAEREGWQARLAELERKARDKADEKALETLEDMNSRHLKVLRFIQNKAIEALKAMSIESAMDAVRAYGLSLDKERTIRGEPNERSAISIEEIIKEEMRELLVVVDDDEPDGEDGHDEPDSEAP
jgi:transposase